MKGQFYGIVLLPVASITILIMLFMTTGDKIFDAVSQAYLDHISEQFVSLNREEIRDKVLNIQHLISFENEQIESVLKSDLQEKLDMAVTALDNIYHTNRDRLDYDELRSKAVEHLSIMRFYDGRGYFHVLDYDSLTMLGHPIKQLVGQDFSVFEDAKGTRIAFKQKQLLEKEDTVFVQLYFYKPDDLKTFYPKLIIATHYKPLNLLIGTGEYLDEVTVQLQQKVIDHVHHENDRFKKNYLFIHQINNIEGGRHYAKILATLAKSESIGKLIDSDFKDANGFAYREEMLKQLKQHGEAYITYRFATPDSDQPRLKQSYFYWQKDWNWIIGSGFYVDEQATELNSLKQAAMAHLTTVETKNFYIMLTVLLSSVLAALYISMRYRGVIAGYIKKVESQNSELETARAKAEEATGVKSMFLANMSHELRTPMNAVIGMTRLALDGSLNDKERDYIAKANGAARSLMQLINDILDFSRIEAGKLVIESRPFRLSQTIEHVAALARHQAEDKGITFSLKVSPQVPDTLLGDQLRISQVLINLTSNAVKFTDSGGTVDLSVSVQEETAGQVVLLFSVADTGIGMADAFKHRLFDAFTQADPSTTRKYGGSGLGLSIVNQLVRLMSAEIQVESEQGIGSTFHFRIPLGKILPGPDNAEDRPAITEQAHTDKGDALEHLQDARILLVEDNDLNRELASLMLSNSGMEVATAANGKQALELLGQQAFDGVLMDCQMPVMNGYDATRAIRQNEKWKHLPVIALSGNAMQEDIEKSLQAGMDDHISKPVDPEIIFQVMAKWIRVR